MNILSYLWAKKIFMEFIDQLEVMLRTVPPYILFAGMGCYIFSWINKNRKLSIWGDVFFVLAGLFSLWVMIGDYIPSPLADGIVEEHIKKLISMLTLIVILSVASLIDILLKLIWKKETTIMAIVIFLFSLVVFFQSTKMSRVKFELNVPAVEQNADIVEP